MKFTRLLTAAAGLLAMAACGDLPTTGRQVDAPQGASRPRFGAASSVAVSPSTADVQQGTTLQLSAQAYDAGGTPVAGTPTWSSASPSIASVSSSGVVTGNSAGYATIYAIIDGVAGSATIGVYSTWTEQRSFSCAYEQGGHIWVSTDYWEREYTKYPDGTVVAGEPYYVRTETYDNGPTAGIGYLPCDYYDGTNW